MANFNKRREKNPVLRRNHPYCVVLWLVEGMYKLTKKAG
jgi:hypothetical protein